MEPKPETIITVSAVIILAVWTLFYIHNFGYSQFYLDEEQTGTNETSDINNYENSNSTIFETYSDDDFGLRIQYPSDWEVKTKDLDYELVIFSAPEGDVQAAVKVIPRDKHETLKQFGDKTFKKSDNFRISEYYRNKNTTFAGLPAIKMVGTYYYTPNLFQSLKGEESYVREVMWVISLVENKDAFVGVAYFADKSDFKQYLPDVEKMINSVKLTAKSPTIQEEEQ